MLLLFAVAVLIDVARRFTQGSDPIGPTMIGMSIVAGIINYLCLRLLQKLENKDVNLRAATTFSLNDFISNGGIVDRWRPCHVVGRELAGPRGRAGDSRNPVVGRHQDPA